MPSPANRLIGEKSPYLLQHAYNPVDWFPWGEEAFQKAVTEQKPIFLSIGYSTCHWCHVMERESFENPEIAEILNRYFVSIKVDREERPDVDRVYMMFVQSTTGSGGWPMSIFLTSDLQPFLGGTYYPPDDRYGRPGFSSLLRRLAEIWHSAPDKVIQQGENITLAIQRHLEEAQNIPPGPLNSVWIETAYRQFASSFDPEEGGFSVAPKFPRPSVFNFLLRCWQLSKKQTSLDMVEFSLRKMAEGGIHDHLGGGFHRYSVDQRWHVPHFEKMLYDQAQLVVCYCEAYQATGDDEFASVARDILDYVLRDLTAPEGGFYSAEDADSLPSAEETEKKEGAFYVWTQSHLDAALTSEESLAFRRIFGVEIGGNVDPASDPHGELRGTNVLFRAQPVGTVAKLIGKTEQETRRLVQSAQEKLKAVRDRRPRPHLDDKIVTAWNGLMISGLARAAQIFDEDHYMKAAQRAAKFLQENLYDRRLRRSFRGTVGAVNGFAEDYAFLIQGLLDLYETDFDIGWLQWAGELQVQMNALFSDPRGGFFNTEEEVADILFRMKDDHDGAEPAANSVAALNLARLAAMFDREEFRTAAVRTIASYSSALDQMAASLPQLLVSQNAATSHFIQVVLAGDRDTVRRSALLQALRKPYLPQKIVLLADGAEGQAWLAKHIPAIEAMVPTNDQPTAYVCHNFACDLPVTDPVLLSQKLEDLVARR